MILVQTRRQFEAALDVLRRAKHIAFDSETHGLEIYKKDSLIGLSAHCVMPDNAEYAINFYFPFRHNAPENQMNLFTLSENLPIEWLSELSEILNRNDVELYFHHMKFDAQVFRKEGLWISPNIENVHDTMVQAQMVDENKSHRLEDVGASIFGDHIRQTQKDLKTTVKKAGGWSKTTPKQMADYACQDAQLTFNIDPVLKQSLVDQNLIHLLRREMRFQQVLMEMEWEGIELDRTLARDLSKRSRQRMREIEDELDFDPQSKLKLSHVLFGDPSTGGLGLPYSRDKITKNKSKEFPEGIPTMDAEVLVNLRHPIADLVLEYRGLGKANSTWYEGWLRRMSPDGRIHPTYNVSEKKEKFGTVTSRLSSFIQQMPRDPNAMVKLLLRPGEGNVLVEFDYSQIEYRLAACYANDEDLIEQLRAGADVHQELALRIGVDRQSAKQTVYTILYGGQEKALAINLMKQVWLNEKRRVDISLDTAREIINAYYSVHPKMRQISRKAEAHARKHGYVQLWNGRRRHFYKSQPWTHRKAFNSVLQGGAAQIIVESMLAFHEMRDVEPFRQRVQVHDSLWFEIPEADLERASEIITKTMEWPSAKFPVPFPVDSKIIRRRELDDFQQVLLGKNLGKSVNDEVLSSI